MVLLHTLLLFLWAGTVLGQEREVTGTVTEQESGESIPGVNVIVKGTSSGVITDIDGNYSINVPQERTTLVFSFIGYRTQEISIGNRNQIDVQLETDLQSLDEVIVVGYGTQEKRHLTGSVGSIEMDETLASRPVGDFGQAMYGKIAGVRVLNASGRPGESSRIQIRGINSLSGGTAPLIVIDGIPLPSFDLNTINSTDIKSIEILKDAASAAIYGSRGANGVVLVTTKSGQAGEAQITVNYSYSSQEIMRKVNMMNGPQYAQAAIDGAQNGWIDSGGDPNAPNTIEARGEYKYTWPEELEQPETLWDTDFQDLVNRVAPMHKVDLSISGGDQNSTYYLSAGVHNQKGIIKTTDFQRYTMNMKAQSNLADWLTVGGILNISYNNESVMNGATINAAREYPPIYPVYGENGNLGGPNSVPGFENHYNILMRADNQGHPYWHLYGFDDQRHELNALSNLYAEVAIVPGLKYRSSFNATYSRGDRILYEKNERGVAVPSRARTYSSMVRTLQYTSENLLIYTKNWENHQVDAVVGYEFNQRDYYNLVGDRRDYDNDLIPYLSAGNTIINAADGANEYALSSILSRVSYSYNNKYLASATFRRDGSSRFGPENKWGNFPSFSAGWVASEEGFMNLEFLSYLKIRASYGFTGNDNFSNYGWISQMQLARVAIGHESLSSYYPSSVQNPDLAWERTKQLNIGFDFGFMNDRFSLEADLYQSQSDGLLLDVPVPSTSGFNSVLRNIGALETKGLELNFNSHNLTGAFTWSSQITYSLNRSLVKQMGPNDAPMIFGRSSMNLINQVGEVPFSFYAYEYDGVYMNQSELDAHPVDYGFQVNPGDGRYKDVNDDGIINSEDRKIIGNSQPDFIWAFGNNFSYNNFDFSFQLHGSVGGQIYSAQLRRSIFNHEGRNYFAVLENRWRSEEEPGDGYHYKLSVDLNGFEKQPSSYWLVGATYARLRDVTLGYTLPGTFAERVGISKARVYFNGVNLLNYQAGKSVSDPENTSGSTTDPAVVGVQHNPYPTARIYTLGLNIHF
jgi:TonB-linked SusC/RagA family outer membrane protein